MPVRATKLLTTVVSNNRGMAAVRHGRDPGRRQRGSAAADPRPGLAAGELQAGRDHPAAAGHHLPGHQPRTAPRPWPPTDKTGLLYSGQEALSGLADRLTKADSTFKDKLVEGRVLAVHRRHPVLPGRRGEVRRERQLLLHPQGGSGRTPWCSAPPTAARWSWAGSTSASTAPRRTSGDKLTIGDDAAALAGGKETSTGMVLNFAESVAVYVPPAGSKDPMKLVAATRGLVGANFK